MQSNLVPLRNFVHEVLRRSQTSGTVLQTALCYLEAIRLKVSELAKQEQCGEGVRGEVELGSRIVKEEDTEETGSSPQLDLTLEAIIDVDKCGLTPISLPDVSLMDTGDSQAHYSECTNISQASDSVPSSTLKNKVRAPPLPPPSPLLCPRRAFFASLILASKILQDRCYSNRTWAKLSGLPPR